METWIRWEKECSTLCIGPCFLEGAFTIGYCTANKTLNILKILAAFAPKDAWTKYDPFIGWESCDSNFYSTRGDILKQFIIKSTSNCFISFILKSRNEPPSYRPPRPIFLITPLEFVQDVHLDIRVSWKSFEELILIIILTQVVGGDYSFNLFFSSHSNFDLPLMWALEKYLCLPIPPIRICGLFPFDVSYTAYFPANTGSIKNLRKLYFFRGRTRQSSRVVDAKNPASIISSRGSFFKRSSLHLEHVIHPSLGFRNSTCTQPDLLPSPPALKIGRFYYCSQKLIANHRLISIFDKARRCKSTFRYGN